MTKATFPKSIIPSPNYLIIDFTPNCFWEKYFLLRYTEGDAYENDKSLYHKHFQASRFVNGLSVVLYSVYGRSHAKRIIKKDPQIRQFEPWEQGREIVLPHFFVKKSRGFVGINFRNITSVTEKSDIRAKDPQSGNILIRTDTVYFKIIHEPNKSNYWHCGIHLFAINSKTNKEYRFIDDTNVSKSQVNKVASRLMEKVIGNVVGRTQMVRYYLPDNIYQP